MPLRDHFSPESTVWAQWHGFTLTWACHALSRLNQEVLNDDFLALLRPHKPHEAFRFEAVEPDAVAGTGPDVFPPRPGMAAFGPFAEPGCTDLYVRSKVLQRPVARVMWANPEFTGSPAARRTFAVKLATALQEGASVVAVNVVTDPPADLHAELAEVMRLPTELAWRSPTGLSAVVYRVGRVRDRHRLDVWPYPLAVGDALPTVPLWLEDRAVRLDLDTSYAEACRSLRVDDD